MSYEKPSQPTSSSVEHHQSSSSLGTLTGMVKFRAGKQEERFFVDFGAAGEIGETEAVLLAALVGNFTGVIVVV